MVDGDVKAAELDVEGPFRAVAREAGSLTFRDWAAPVCAAALIVISALHMGAFWRPAAEVIGAGLVLLLCLVLGLRRVDRATALVLASSLALAAWWFVRAAGIGQPLSFFPFGVSAVGFGCAFAAVRPLTGKQREMAALFLATIGALEACAGFYGITLRSSPLAIPDQNLWRLASTVTYSNAAGLILAMALVVALGLNERWWYSRGLVCVCTAGLLATQSRGALIGALCGLCFVPFARYTVMWLPMAFGVIAGLVAVATSSSTRPEPVVAVALVLCVAASVLLRPVPLVVATRRRVTFVAVGGVVVAGVAASVLHTVVARRFFSSASLWDRNPEWSSAYHQFLSAPWLGVGPDRPIPLLGGNGTFAHFAHNEYLQVADDAGVIGVVLLVLLIVAVAKSVRRTDVATSCALGALIVFAFCGAFDFDWHLPMIVLLGGWVAGLAGRATSEVPPDDGIAARERDPDVALTRARRPAPRHSGR
jgi:O-antigen ligase